MKQNNTYLLLGFVVWGIFWGNVGFAQKPNGKFLNDSIEIGKPIDYALSFRHKPSAEIFFPDTTYDFKPFEIIRRNIFQTNTTNDESVDSVVYTLVSFDIAKTQKLNLPIFLLGKRDCTLVYGIEDSVMLKEMIQSKVDSLQLLTDAKLVPLQQQINYPQILTIFFTLLGIIVTIYALFGNYLRKQYDLFFFSRKHKDFQAQYKKFAKSTLDSASIGKALVLWKMYLEWLERKPYTSYTTKEIIEQIPSESLEEALREIDTAIYGGILSTQMPFSMSILLDKANELYKVRRNELKNTSK